MTFIRLTFFYLICVVGHWWLGAHFSPGGVTPSLLLSATAAVATLGGPIAAHAFAFMCGLYLDFVSPHLFGGHALVFTLLAYVIWFVKWRLDFPTPLPQMGLVFAATVFSGAVYGALELVFKGNFVWRGWAFSFFTPVANALISPVLFALAAMFVSPDEKARYD